MGIRELWNAKLTDYPYDSELVAIQWLDIVSDQMRELSHSSSLASWNYETNITNENSDTLTEVMSQVNQYSEEIRDKANDFNFETFSQDTQRQFKLILQGGQQATKEHQQEFQNIQSRMLEIYSTGEICGSKNSDVTSGNGDRSGFKTSTKKQCLTLEPDLIDLMAKSRDYDELLWAWKNWRDVVGVPIGKLYPEYITLLNEGARAKGYKDAVEELFLMSYDMDALDKLVEDLFEELRPLYVHLHAYVRDKLVKFYGSERVDPTSPIPAHLLGNMWAQQWSSIYDILEPYPDETSADVTSEMKSQNYTPIRMLKMADEFFQSLGLQPMPKTFWEKSVFVKPIDRDVVCHPSAEDFFVDQDVRIKMCTEVNMYDFYTVHHEMGHCQYYLNYRVQPSIYRSGANPAFHEAVGDTIALSVNTPKHLHSVGLLDTDDRTYERDINFLMRQALERITLLPYALVIDKWRWEIYRGQTKPGDYNSRYWQLRRDIQGVAPPVNRTEHDFDPGAKHHVAAGIPYIRYFVSFLIQFQFHEAVCKEAGHTGPIHRCDIYGSKEAGTKLRHMMELGRSRPWPDAMEVITGQRNIKTGSILTYFQPLMDWLQSHNKDIIVGW
ncbi:angiotensin-converting enzyme-like [Glandiceps talaboti]